MQNINILFIEEWSDIFPKWKIKQMQREYFQLWGSGSGKDTVRGCIQNDVNRVWITWGSIEEDTEVIIEEDGFAISKVFYFLAKDIEWKQYDR